MAIRTWESDEYHSFWSHSDFAYLDRMERKLLGKLMESGNWFVDIGGGYGRLMDIYKDRFSNVVITDYSISMLEDANRRLVREGIKNVSLIAADAHKLPFIDNVFDSAMMVRLIHHIVNPTPVIQEVYRILGPQALFIFEYQNKRNLSFLIKSKLGLMNQQIVKTIEPYEAGPLYWKFHPHAMEHILTNWFTIKRILGGGLFWNRKIFTSIFPRLELFDSLIAVFLGRHSLTHQLFLKLQANKERSEFTAHNIAHDHSLFNILQCPRCSHQAFEPRTDQLVCIRCQKSYKIIDNIYDFRLDAK